jgi:hypothetical protein
MRAVGAPRPELAAIARAHPWRARTRNHLILVANMRASGVRPSLLEAAARGLREFGAGAQGFAVRGKLPRLNLNGEERFGGSSPPEGLQSAANRLLRLREWLPRGLPTLAAEAPW